jgi:hypothetical protein
MTATTTDFKKARLGSVAMEGCGACGCETGSILMKKRGNPNGPEYLGPNVLVNPEARCEFCHFLGVYMADQGIEPGKKKHGAAKIVEEDNEGVRKLLAYVPFDEDEDQNKQLHDGTPFTFKHRMVIKAENRGDQHTLVAILEEGV